MTLDVYGLIGQQGEAITGLQMALRAVLIFGVGLVYVRLAGARVFGKWGVLDIVLAVIIGSNLSRTITGSAPFGPTLLATATLIGLHALLAHAAVLWPWLGVWLKGRPIRLIADGVIDEAMLRRQAIGHGDLAQALRRVGLDNACDVRAAYLERSGEISVLRAPLQD